MDVFRPIVIFEPRSASSITRAVARHRKLESDMKRGSAAGIIDTLLLRGPHNDEE